MNSITISGVIGKIDASRTKTGKSKLYFSLAHHKRSRDSEEITQWYNIVVWGNAAEYLAPRLSVGMKVVIDGWLDQYTTTDGNTMIQINAREVHPIAKFVVQDDAKGASQSKFKSRDSNPYDNPRGNAERLNIDNEDMTEDPFSEEDSHIFNV